MIWINEFILLAGALIAAVGWGLWLMDKSSLKTNCPEAPLLMKARKERLPILMLRNPGNNYCKMVIGKKKEKNSIEIDCGDENVHFSPEFLGHTQCDLLSGDIVLYHGSIVDPTLMSPENAVALNRMGKVRNEFPELRCLHNQDLHALMACPADHLDHNCAVLWGELVEEDSSRIPIDVPASLDDFVSLIEQARAYFDELPLYEAEIIGETYESIRKKKSVLPQPQKQSFLARILKQTPKPRSGKGASAPVPDTSAEYVYVNARRRPVGIQLFSYAAAVQSLSSAYTAQHVTQLKLKVEAKTLQNVAKNKDDMLKWLFIGGMSIGIVIICAAVAINILG